MSDDRWIVGVHVTPLALRTIRRVFSIPDEISDEELAQVTAQDTVDRYLYAERFGEKDMAEIVDCIMARKERDGTADQGDT